MKRKLIVLGLALMGFVGALCLQPRPVAADSTCFCDSPACCNWCCRSGGRILCSERPCILVQ
jgi:hypothetical protein